MKNKKFLSLAFAIALLVTMVPASLAADFDDIVITGTVDDGIAITAGADVSLTTDPANGTETHDTDPGSGTGNTLTVWNNNTAGFSVVVALEGRDTGDTANTLGIATTATTLAGGSGTIKFKSSSSLGGSGVAAYAVYSGSTTVWTGGSVLTSAGTITVNHELHTPVTVTPGIYVGDATYTIASL